MARIKKSPILKPQLMQGSTLLEVLISVFIMAFGIMALMLAQLKSVGNVREAEMQTRVAQAVQNLSAGMLSNPDVITNLGSASNINAKLQYSNYKTSSWVNVDSNPPSANMICGSGSANSTVKNNEFTTCIINAFVNELKIALPNASNIAYKIDSTSGATPTTTISVKWSETNDTAPGANSDNYDFQYSAVVGD
ncbi:hypothetical protein A7P89_05895 [Eikenella corrodens]|uniref:Type IV pilus modification protein PilV n=1 Tax=Eikenella corrodens TaxID=539 RepID=A0A1A9RQM9_EIKCO|nr:hypothetical protein [Eikenella corrodens]OAM22311.1 hypothetical protein A7P89_05895 [Eikenella corrodens]